MKNIVLSVALIVCFTLLRSQDKDEWGMPYNKDKKMFIYEEVVPVSGIKKDELYNRAENWIKTYYVSGLKKIIEKDQAQGFIKLNHRFTVMKDYKGQVVNDVIINYRMELSFKEGKFRYQIFKFYCGLDANAQPIERWITATGSDPEVAKVRYKKIDEEIQKTISSLKKAMQVAVTPKTDDW